MPTIALPGAGISRRIVGHATFALTSLASLAIAREHDVALVESPPLFLGATARALRACGIPYVFHVADPWPDFAIAMGYLRSPLERRLAFGLEDFAYRGAAAITTVSPGLVDLLSRKPSASGRVELVPNGVEVARFDVGLDPSSARRQLGWDRRSPLSTLGRWGCRVSGRSRGGEPRGREWNLCSLARDRETGTRGAGAGDESRNVTFHSSVPETKSLAFSRRPMPGLVLPQRAPLRGLAPDQTPRDHGGKPARDRSC